MASVTSDGPFSLFPGIDRKLLILEGHGLELTFSNGHRLVLERFDAPFSFLGEEPIISRLPDGPVVDFNVMTRRGVLEQSVAYLKLMPGDSVSNGLNPGMLFLLGAEAVFEHEGGGERLQLSRYDLLLFGSEKSIVLQSDKPVECILLQNEERHLN